MSVSPKSSREARGGIGVERVDVHDERVVVPSGQGPALLEARSRGSDEHERKVPQALEEPFDQIEHEIVGPVEVGEREHERPAARVTFEVRRDRSHRVVAGARRLDGRSGEAFEDVEQALDDPLDLRRLGAVEHVGDRRAQLLADRHVAVLVALTCIADRLRDGRPHVGVPVGRALPAEHQRAAHLLGVLRELEHEPALADAGVAEQEHELGPPPPAGDRERVAQHTHLGVAPDERAASAAAPASRWCGRVHRDPRVDGLVPASHRERTERLVAHRARVAAYVARTDDDLARLRRGLEPARGVDDVAHHGRVAPGTHRADQHLAGVDPDPQGHLRRLVGGELLEGFLHLQRGAHAALGVVFVGDRDAEARDERVADDLVELAAEGAHVGDEAFERAIDQVLHLLGVGRLREGGETDDVGHEHGDEAALVGRVASACPHSGQNRAVSGTHSPHAGHNMRSGYRGRVSAHWRNKPQEKMPVEWPSFHVIVSPQAPTSSAPTAASGSVRRAWARSAGAARAVRDTRRTGS